MSRHASGTIAGDTPGAAAGTPNAAWEALLRSADALRGWRVLTRSRVHDMRGRLNAANLFLDLLLSSVPAAMELDGDQRETWTRHLSKIRSELRAVAETLGELVPPQEEDPDTEADVDPAALLEQLVSGLRHVAGVRGVTFDVRMPETLHAIRTRPSRLRHALLDVLLDALDARDAGDSLRVDAADETRALRIEVRGTPDGPAAPRADAPTRDDEAEARRRVTRAILEELGARTDPLPGGGLVVELPRNRTTREGTDAARTAG
jgi:hypothetical protein